MDLDNNTRLAWDPVPGPDGKPDASISYEILRRETNQSVWQSVSPAPEPGAYSCPLSKDNYYFAVRAVSAGGHPSLPAVAR